MDNHEEELEPHKNEEPSDAEDTGTGDTTPKNEGLTPEEFNDLKKRADASSQNFERAKKAEEELKKIKQSQSPKEDKTETLSAKDALLLAKGNIELEDVDTVVDYAKFRKMNISEALQDSTLKSIIADRVEERQTAKATQTKGRSAPKVSSEALIEQARRGNVPDSEDDIEKLTNARMEGKLAKRNK